MSSSPWEVLGISATHDERAIKRAYAQTLKRLDPNDRDGFIALRDAYERVLEEAMEIRYWQEEEQEYALCHAAEDEAQSDERAFDAEMPGDDVRYQEDESVYAFIEDCWQSWESSENEDELLALLKAQHEALNAEGIHTAIDYSDSLQEWFYQNEHSLPRAFAWAADVHHWQLHNYGWRMQALSERYPMLVNPQLVSYPALARWDARWQEGIWARVGEMLNPWRYAEVRAQLCSYFKNSCGLDERTMPASIAAFASPWYFRMRTLSAFFFILLLAGLFTNLHEKVSPTQNMLFVLFAGGVLAVLMLLLFGGMHRIGIRVVSRRGLWFAGGAGMVLLAGVAYCVSLAGARWLFFNLVATLAVFLAASAWHSMLGKQWLASAAKLRLSDAALAGFGLFVCWALLYSALQAGAEHQSYEQKDFFALLLPLAGAGFAYEILRRTPLPAQIRSQYAGMLGYAAVLLPFFWLMLSYADMDAQSGIFAWVVKTYLITSVIGIYATPRYREWPYLIPLVLGLIAFAALIYGWLPALWLLQAQLGIWLLLPFAILLTPRYPRLGFLLPETLRVIMQSILGLVVPLFFWETGWYIAFAASVAVVVYLLWLDAMLDDALLD